MNGNESNAQSTCSSGFKALADINLLLVTGQSGIIRDNCFEMERGPASVGRRDLHELRPDGLSRALAGREQHDPQSLHRHRQWREYYGFIAN